MTKAHTGSKFRSLLATIRKHFKSLDIAIKTKKIAGLEINEFYINAFYDLDADKNNECSIEVIIYHDIDTDMFFEHSQVGQFLVQLYDAVVHELHHQEQGRKRKYHPNPYIVDLSCNESYLSDPDEIDAYALSIAIELIRNLGRSRSIQYLHRASRLANVRPKGLYASPNLFAYFKTFGTVQHPVIRKLIKKVFLNLETLDKNSVFY
jgi:hypothetical protein